MTKFSGWLLLSVLWIGQAFAQPENYTKQPGVAGKLTSVGSDTMANLVGLWSQSFKTLYPHVTFQLQASGSSTAPPALTEGTANIGPMSRELKASELNYFRRTFGYDPVVIKVAVDAIAIFVDHKNPLPGLNLQQVDAIFSATRFCGAPQSVNSWSQLGTELPGLHGQIKLYGRNAVSGTYGMFKRDALCDGDFKATVNEQPGSASVVQSVAYSNGAIGYAGFGYKTAGVRALPIALEGTQYVAVNSENIASGDYPLSRYLYIVVNKPPGKSLPLLVQEFLRFVLSPEGQQVVRKEGYVPIPAQLVQQQLETIL